MAAAGALVRPLAVFGDPERVRIGLPAEPDLPRLLGRHRRRARRNGVGPPAPRAPEAPRLGARRAVVRSPAVFSDFIDWIESLGFLAVFLLAMLDSVGLPATGDAIVITYSAASDKPLGLIILVAFLGGVCGDHIAYWVGRLGGARLLHRFLDPAEGAAARRDDGQARAVGAHLRPPGRRDPHQGGRAGGLGAAELPAASRSGTPSAACSGPRPTRSSGRTVGKRIIDALESADRVILIVVGVAIVRR